MSEPHWFCIRTINGKSYPSIEHHNEGDSREPFLGETVRYHLDEDAKGVSLQTLTCLYMQFTEKGFE